MKSITDELAELRALDVDALVDRYVALFGRDPRSKNKHHLWRRCAWKLQETRLGGLSKVAQRKIDEIADGIELPIEIPVRATVRKNGDIPVGTVLTREWRGQRVEVRVTDQGFEHEGVPYRSLSAVASKITGAHWSGKLFFGLRQRSNA